MLTKEEIVQKLDKLQDIERKVGDIARVLDDAFGGCVYEGKLFSAYLELFDSYLEALAKDSGISADALCWWVYSAEWGRSTCNEVEGKDGNVIVLRDNKEFVAFEMGE